MLGRKEARGPGGPRCVRLPQMDIQVESVVGSGTAEAVVERLGMWVAALLPSQLPPSMTDERGRNTEPICAGGGVW